MNGVATVKWRVRAGDRARSSKTSVRSRASEPMLGWGAALLALSLVGCAGDANRGAEASAGTPAQSGGAAGVTTQSGGTAGVTTQSGGAAGAPTQGGGTAGVTTQSGGTAGATTQSGGAAGATTQSGGAAGAPAQGGAAGDTSLGGAAGAPTQGGAAGQGGAEGCPSDELGSTCFLCQDHWICGGDNTYTDVDPTPSVDGCYLSGLPGRHLLGSDGTITVDGVVVGLAAGFGARVHISHSDGSPWLVCARAP